MPNQSFSLQSGILEHIFRSSSFPKPSVIAVALCTKVPGEFDTGTTISEPSMSNGYARANLGGPNDLTWTQPVPNAVTGSGYITNLSGITFPQNTNSDWGWCSGIAVCDNQGVGSGSVLYSAALSAPQLIQVGTTFSFPSGNFTVFAH